MSGPRAERFVIFNLRLMALGFAVVGALFIITPDGVLDSITDLGESLGGGFSPAPPTTEKFWLALGFAYMVVIAGIALVAQADPVRYRPLIMVLVAGKAASSLAALGFYLFDDDVFMYLVNFIVDGLLTASALLLWSLAGRVGEPQAPA
ncbi:MAG: hypothetical protein QOG09_287 [Solirubrobacterales bacterium]|jgi:hypothetical protein|nr:hypothetical protein [Solirubrobacterales bacterium]MDX6662185.1 hypothetical protein [Solirubrobacterales bacterium]